MIGEWGCQQPHRIPDWNAVQSSRNVDPRVATVSIADPFNLGMPYSVAESGVMGFFSNLCGLESILAVVTRMPMLPETRCLKPTLNMPAA